MLEEGTLITFEKVVFRPEPVPEVRDMRDDYAYQEFFEAGVAIRSNEELWELKWSNTGTLRGAAMIIFLQKDGDDPKRFEASAKTTLGEVRQSAKLRSGRFIFRGREYEQKDDYKLLADLGICARSTLSFINWIGVTVEIDALYHYPALKEEDGRQPLENYIYGIGNSQWIGGIYYHIFSFHLQEKPSSHTSRSCSHHSQNAHFCSQQHSNDAVFIAHIYCIPSTFCHTHIPCT